MNSHYSDRCPCEGDTLTRFIQPIILSILRENPCHGYLLIRQIEDTILWRDYKPDPTGVYRAVKELEKKGLIQSKIIYEDNSGTEKKIFFLTENGETCLQSWHKTLLKYSQGINELVEMLAQVSV